MKPVRIGSDAEAELAAAADRYEAERPGLAAQFLLVVRAALVKVSHFPASGVATRARGRAAVRRVVLPRFPFSLVYVDDDDAIVVIAVAHTSRRPKYWLGRIARRH